MCYNLFINSRSCLCNSRDQGLRFNVDRFPDQKSGWQVWCRQKVNKGLTLNPCAPRRNKGTHGLKIQVSKVFMLNQSDGAFFHKKVSSVALWIVFAFVLEKKKKLIFVETS